MQQAKVVKEVVVCLVTEEREDKSVAVTCPDIPMFYVVGENEPRALDDAVAVLVDMFELHNISVRDVRITRENLNALFDLSTAEISVQAYVIAELTAQ